MNVQPESLSVAQCASLACLMEVVSPKVGNVHRAADFDDLCFADFAISAALLGDCMQRAAEGVGAAIHKAVRTTKAMVGSNTNLGIALLLGPLSAVEGSVLSAGIQAVLDRLDEQDAAQIYLAISLAQAGGMGEAEKWDVNRSQPPPSIVEAMRLAEQRDLIARQYTHGFELVFDAARRIETELDGETPLETAVMIAHLGLLAEHRDSLIERKCGADIAAQTSTRSAAVLALRDDEDAFLRAVGGLDFWLRSDGHRRNPGATADLIAAGLFVLLRERRMAWPFPTSGQLARNSSG